MSSSGEMDTAPGNTEANPPWGSLQGIETGGSVKLTTTVLTGLNYQQWANAIEIALEGRGLFEFVTGEFQKPDQTTQTAQYKKWRRLDCQVLTLLQNSIDSKISEIFFNHKTSKDLWDAINKHYGKRTNHSHIYHLKRTVQNTTQNHRTILEYTTDLRRGWEELKIYLPLTSDPKILQERENDQVYQFLGGLDDSYEAIRAQILLSAELPHLDDVMARIQGEETRRLLMVAERVETQAMVAAARKPNPKSERGSGNKCDHCKKEGHHKDGCWFLHPNLRPKWWKERPEEERAKNPREKKKGYGAT